MLDLNRFSNIRKIGGKGFYGRRNFHERACRRPGNKHSFCYKDLKSVKMKHLFLRRIPSVIRQKIRSLRFSTILVLILIIFLLGSLIAYNNYAAYALLLKNIYQNTEHTLMLYEQHLDQALERTQTFLFTVSTNNSSLTTLKYTGSGTTSWFQALYQLKNNLQNSLAIYTMDDIFCYIPGRDTFVTGSASYDAAANSIRSMMRNAAEGDSLPLDDWAVYGDMGNYYLLRTLHIQNAYVGAWVSLDTLLNEVIQNNDSPFQLCFTSSDGRLLTGSSETASITPPEEKEDPYAIEMIAGERFLTVSKKMASSPLYLTILIPEEDFSQNRSDMILMVAAAFGGVFLIWFIFVAYMEKWILKPVRLLTSAIKQLKRGDLEVSVAARGQLDEFQDMTNAFNTMVCEIKNLKIDVYEQKLASQRLEALYLKQQITPHFMINCLNTAYQLTETGRYDLTREMLKDLSRHLRFILSSEQTVSLGEELSLVDNYIELSGIRYPYSIRYICQCPRELYSATAIPLLLLNFVENTIKHEVSMGQLLEIHIEAGSYQQDGQSRLAIHIWDTGKGFSQKALSSLSDIDRYLENESEHIGISNVVMRARHIYKDARFTFFNRPSKGAQIDIDLPYIPFDGKIL